MQAGKKKIKNKNHITLLLFQFNLNIVFGGKWEGAGSQMGEGYILGLTILKTYYPVENFEKNGDGMEFSNDAPCKVYAESSGSGH